MNLELLNHLRCLCKGNLEVSEAKNRTNDHLIEGWLQCVSCGRRVPVKEGIPLFVSSSTDSKTQKNFGYSWNFFADIYQKEKTDFLNWLYPVDRGFFKNKLILDAGCGNGLHARMASEFGAKTVIGMDLSSAVNAAFFNTRKYHNVHIIKANIYDPPFAKAYFDYIYSIGVIQHLPRREKAIELLISCLKKGGSLSLWVYGYEGTLFVRLIIEPLRRVLSLLNPKIIFAISIFPACFFYLYAKLLQGIAAKKGSLNRFLPMGSYFTYMGNFPFKYQFNTVFDQLVAPRTHYFKKEELANLFNKFNFEKISITSRNKMSWRIFAGGKK